MKVSTSKIKSMMIENLMTQQMLADKSGVCRLTINSTLLKGSCSIPTVGKIAKALGVDPVEIIEMED